MCLCQKLLLRFFSVDFVFPTHSRRQDKRLLVGQASLPDQLMVSLLLLWLWSLVGILEDWIFLCIGD
jgi:hypothetical protein